MSSSVRVSNSFPVSTPASDVLPARCGTTHAATIGQKRPVVIRRVKRRPSGSPQPKKNGAVGGSKNKTEIDDKISDRSFSKQGGEIGRVGNDTGWVMMPRASVDPPREALLGPGHKLARVACDISRHKP